MTYNLILWFLHLSYPVVLKNRRTNVADQEKHQLEKVVGQTIAKRRQSLGISQFELAERLNIARLSLPNRKRPCRSPLFPAWRDSWDTRLPRLRPFPNERWDAEEHFRYNCRTRRLTSTRKTKNRAWYGVPSRFCAKTVSSHLFQGLLAAMLQKILKWLWNGKTSPPKGIVEESNIIENTVNYRSENPI